VVSPFSSRKENTAGSEGKRAWSTTATMEKERCPSSKSDQLVRSGKIIEGLKERRGAVSKPIYGEVGAFWTGLKDQPKLGPAGKKGVI